MVLLSIIIDFRDDLRSATKRICTKTVISTAIETPPCFPVQWLIDRLSEFTVLFYHIHRKLQ